MNIEIEILKIVLPFILGSFGGALLNHYLHVKKERMATIFHEKRKNYETLLEAIKGFTVVNPDQMEQFFSEMKRSWLYASDDVVKQTRRLADIFVKYSPIENKSVPANEVDSVIGSILLDMRKDLGFKNTQLSADEFHTVSVVKKKIK